MKSVFHIKSTGTPGQIYVLNSLLLEGHADMLTTRMMLNSVISSHCGTGSHWRRFHSDGIIFRLSEAECVFVKVQVLWAVSGCRRVDVCYIQTAVIDSWTRVSQRTYNHDINTQRERTGLESHSIRSNPQKVCSLPGSQKHCYYKDTEMGLADEESAAWLLWRFSTLLSGYYGVSSLPCQWSPQIDGSDSPWVPQIIKIFSLWLKKTLNWRCW